jgi:lysophospholipase L1-like esterase
MGRPIMNRTTAVVTAVAALVLGALVLRFTGIYPRRGPSVVLIGDSITEQSADTFDQRLGGEYDLSTTGRPGFRAEQLLADVPDLADGDPTQVVVNLGTNDMTQGWRPADTEAVLERLAGSFPSARCVHVVTINDHMVNDDPSLVPRVQDLNGRIRAMAARHGWDVVPWDRLVADYDAGPQPFGPITTDTVHPTQLGRDVLADAYERALKACPPAPA